MNQNFLKVAGEGDSAGQQRSGGREGHDKPGPGELVHQEGVQAGEEEHREVREEKEEAQEEEEQGREEKKLNLKSSIFD